MLLAGKDIVQVDVSRRLKFGIEARAATTSGQDLASLGQNVTSSSGPTWRADAQDARKAAEAWCEVERRPKPPWPSPRAARKALGCSPVKSPKLR